jgi:DNA-binding cell septation regulator SpoVG
MKEEEILSGLEKLVESLSIQLRYEKGDFAGGYCVLKDKRMMIVNHSQSPATRIKVLARALAEMNLDDIFVVPALREVIMEAVPAFVSKANKESRDESLASVIEPTVVEN